MRNLMNKQGLAEVLAPAGSPESLVAAVRCGADAVYMAGKSFGARASAKNFTNEELAEAVRYCHARDVGVFVTVNTLLKDDELDEALEFVRFLCELAVDGIIVQDMGLFAMVRECAPELPLHASTQMSIHNEYGARFLEAAGAERVVLARELSLDEISEIKQGCKLELESFVHGALCMSVSGQCYFSAMLGSRSGNRGMCAQPCRLPFATDAAGKDEHALSLRDLSAISAVDEMIKTGVSSFKIEGRMKRPEYVAAAVTAVRREIDGEPRDEALLADLEAVFSRSGFTNGYVLGKLGKDMFGIRTKENVVEASGKTLKRLANLYHKEVSRVPVKLELTEENGKIVLAATSGNHSVGIILEKSESEPSRLSAERCAEQLAKTGGTPFLAEEIDVPENGVGISITELNQARRSALENLIVAKASRSEIAFDKARAGYLSRHELPRAEQKLKLRAAFRSAEQAQPCGDILGDFEKIYLPVSENAEVLNLPKEKLAFELPRAIFGRKEAEKLAKRMEALMSAGYHDFVCYNMGAVQLCKELGAVAHGGYSLNITNSAALDFFAQSGMKTAELSFELSLDEARGVAGELPRGVMLYGHQALMMTRNCSVNTSRTGACSGCTKVKHLTDRKNISFPVVCNERKYSEVLNSVPLYMADRLGEVKGLDFGVLRFTIESPAECADMARIYLEGLSKKVSTKPADKQFTRGLLYRGIM